MYAIPNISILNKRFAYFICSTTPLFLPLQKIDMTPISNDKWLTYEEYQLQQKLMARLEVLTLYRMGLGWLVEFSASFENKK
jgi:hypothetical protein